MTPRDRDFIARLCAQRAGLRVDPEKAYLIETRLAPVARREGFGSVAELVRVLREKPDDVQIWSAVEAMALPETSFFRDFEVFERLWRDVVPELARRRDGGVVRIWSAGCGSGQEVYSLAMLLAEAPPPNVEVQIFASDLSQRAVEKAQGGAYSQFEVQRGLSARRLVEHFEKKDETFVLSRRIRQHVRWRRVNLLDDISRLGVFDVVLCRYVLPCLTDAAAADVAGRLAPLVAPDGVLLLGRDERIAAPGLVGPLPGLPGGFARGGERRAAA